MQHGRSAALCSRTWLQRSQVSAPILCRATSSSSSPDDKPSFHRRSWTRAKLTADEWKEHWIELQEQSISWLRLHRAQKRGFSANDFIEQSHYRWIAANDRFDDWFNAQWPIWQADFWRCYAELKSKSAKPNSAEEQLEQVPKQTGLPLDIPAVILIGVGAGCVSQGWFAGILFSIWGSARGIRRFIVQKVDEEDRDGLFRWVPAASLGWGPAKRAEMFNSLQYQIHAHRKRRQGDPHYTALHNNASQHKAMDPLNDYTPETLFDDAMKSVAKHPRILDALGGQIQDVSEPDKVIYRVVEGIAEVCLAWRIVGPSAEAEIQVKATACLLDYIYVFPKPRGRYQMTPPSFVIRPHGSESQNVEDMPRYQKQPFGREGDSGRLYHNRTGIFEYDWETRDFKHGKENMSDFGGSARSR